ncbi:hypothetical protein [Mariniflexile sp.]|uniref:hypothetical protein n=1 Tax=Mariniflexile sp. TaxID=1979402 RepID=UPI0040487277
MKKIAFAFLLIALIFNFSCDTNDASNIQNIKEYRASLTTWNTLKQTNGTSYTYEIITGSVFGFGTITKITVIKNTVTSRVYEAYTIYDNDRNYLGFENRLILNSYSENTGNLGSNSEGASPVILDDLYNTCLNDYLSVNTNTNTITFNVDDFNIIKDCYYVPDGCQDDCSFGIILTNFEWIETE